MDSLFERLKMGVLQRQGKTPKRPEEPGKNKPTNPNSSSKTKKEKCQ